MKRIISLLLVIVIMLSVLMIAPLSATAVECEVEVTSYMSGDYEYELLDDGTAIITEYTGRNKNIRIPERLDGIDVSSIGSCSFWGLDLLESVYIGNNIDYIEERAFYYCSRLRSITVAEDNKKYKSVDGVLYNKDMTTIMNYPCSKEGDTYNIPDSVTEIDAYCFAFNENLKNMVVPDAVTELGRESFYTCHKLKSLKFGSGITCIDWIFTSCCELSEVSFSDNLRHFDFGNIGGTLVKDLYLPESIVYLEISSNNNLANVYINNEEYYDVGGVLYSRRENKMMLYPKNNASQVHIVPDGVTELTDIESDCLKDIYISKTVISKEGIGGGSLENIYVDEDNTKWCDVDGILYSKDKKTIEIYPNGRKDQSFVVPEGVEEVCEVGNSFLKTIEISSSVKNPPFFSNCENLERIEVSVDNPNYCSIDGVVYNKRLTKLLSIPTAYIESELVIPDTVDTIKIGITKNLKDITISKNCTDVGGTYEGVFPGGVLDGSSLENVFVEEGNEVFYSSNGVLMKKGEKYDTLFLYPPKNKNKSFTFPQGTEIIFFRIYAEYLEDVYIPASATNMHWQSFLYCPNLKNIYVDSENPVYCDVDGVLYDKEVKNLIKYTAGRQEETFVMPDTVEKISSSAFNQNYHLKSIVFSESMTTFDSIFWYCENLKEFTFSKNIKQIKWIHSIGYKWVGGPGHGGYSDEPLDGVVIKGYSGTVAQSYAQLNDFDFESFGEVEPLYGDTDGDSKISVMDATAIQFHLAMIKPIDYIHLIKNADADKDGKVSVMDATQIQMFLAQIIPEL